MHPQHTSDRDDRRHRHAWTAARVTWAKRTWAKRTRASMVVGVLMLATVAACGSDEGAATPPTAVAVTDPATSESPDDTGTTSTNVANSTTTAATTAPSTTAAPTPTPITTAPITTAPITVADLRLSGTAVGPVAFGTGDTPALDVLAPLLGPPAADETATFPTADETGSYQNTDDESIFAFPFLRRVCFDNGFCMSFGGASATELQLVGYDYFTAEVPVEPVLSTTEELPLGARWSDHLDAMTASAGGCYSQGFGESGGVTLVLISSGELFGAFDGETYTTAVPDAADVTVYGMRAGANPGYLYDDC